MLNDVINIYFCIEFRAALSYNIYYKLENHGFEEGHFQDRPINQYNFKLNSWSPEAAFFSIGTHILLR